MKNQLKTLFAAVLCLLFCSVTANAITDKLPDIIIENSQMRLVISPDGKARSLIHKPSGQECLDTNADLPVCAITQYRPYDNENFLMFPAKPRTFPSNKVERIGDTLRVEFEDTYDIAYIPMHITDDYIHFTLDRIDYRIEDFGVKRKTEIDEFTLMQLPVRKRENFGEWLNVIWDNDVAVNLLATSPCTRIDAFQQKEAINLYAGLDFQVKLFHAGAALITTSKDRLLSCIDRLERDYNMPLGVESRRRQEYPYSYYELRDVTTDNIDEHIEYARKGGFKTIVIYYVDFAESCGHYPWRKEYPNGMKDLKEITDKIYKAGMIPGLHLHYSKVGRNDPYLLGEEPDTRLNRVRNFTLARPADSTSTVLYIEENPEGTQMEKDRTLLQIGKELVLYTGYTSTPPYQLTGCTRGVGGSVPRNYEKGEKFGLLDVDDWPLFVRIDQNTGLQKEVSKRLGEIYAGAGFKFVYFDGAEDVPMPYWYNVSRSQLSVYEELNPSPLYAEGALKSHYGWHILSRGNAFDIFPPERIRPAMKKYTARAARQIAKDFTSVNFGWVNYLAPSEKTIGMQPDMYEYICSRALAWNSPISLVGNLKEIRKHPRSDDNLLVISWWEDAKLKGAFSEEQKEALKNLDQEYTILKNKKGGYELYPCEQITTDAEGPVRAFVFERDGKTCIVYWHMSGSGEIQLDADKRLIRLTDAFGKRVSVRQKDGKLILPAAGRLFLDIDLPRAEATALFRNSIGLSGK
ncbi:hypothetical protein [Parabacteroides bouchesdurhonensis]|uniref:hypothetical protein n=1 Tax=Parabacteroides bouchesdurhonensis TaxID=1936995 RepID=UPI001F372DA9|nr:hypothetical protein [Parabacteroides bouchesdurhonensis]